MVVEHVDIRIRPGEQAAFEAAMKHGLHSVLARAAGMRGFSFDRCIESPERYVLRVWWDRLEDHTVTYRQGPLTVEFRALVSQYFAEPPVLEHFETVVQRPPALEADRTGPGTDRGRTR